MFYTAHRSGISLNGMYLSCCKNPNQASRFIQLISLLHHSIRNQVYWLHLGWEGKPCNANRGFRCRKCISASDRLHCRKVARPAVLAAGICCRGQTVLAGRGEDSKGKNLVSAGSVSLWNNGFLCRKAQGTSRSVSMPRTGRRTGVGRDFYSQTG